MGGAFWTVLSIIVVAAWAGSLFLWFLVRHSRKAPLVDPKGSVKLLSVLGSGGHTTEMIDLLKAFDDSKYPDRYYVVAETDNHSESKAIAAESARTGGHFAIFRIPRSREVGQSYVTAVFTTALAAAASFALICRVRPSLVVVNGPGTCIPVAFSAALLDVLRIADTRIVYVESLCRVEKLSLSAAILYYSGVADDVIVQWPQLKDTYPRVLTVDELKE